MIPKGILTALSHHCPHRFKCIFAQVEQIRLNLTDQDPVVCAQWNSVIAVSYASRKFGITRMDTIASCKSKCPNVIIAHAAVYKKGVTLGLC